MSSKEGLKKQTGDGSDNRISSTNVSSQDSNILRRYQDFSGTVNQSDNRQLQGGDQKVHLQYPYGGREFEWTKMIAQGDRRAKNYKPVAQGDSNFQIYNDNRQLPVITEQDENIG